MSGSCPVCQVTCLCTSSVYKLSVYFLKLFTLLWFHLSASSLIACTPGESLKRITPTQHRLLVVSWFQNLDLDLWSISSYFLHTVGSMESTSMRLHVAVHFVGPILSRGRRFSVDCFCGLIYRFYLESVLSQLTVSVDSFTGFGSGPSVFWISLMPGLCSSFLVSVWSRLLWFFQFCCLCSQLLGWLLEHRSGVQCSSPEDKGPHIGPQHLKDVSWCRADFMLVFLFLFLWRMSFSIW